MLVKWAALTCPVVTMPLLGKTSQVSFERALGTVVGGALGFLATALATRWWTLVSAAAAPHAAPPPPPPPPPPSGGPPLLCGPARRSMRQRLTTSFWQPWRLQPPSSACWWASASAWTCLQSCLSSPFCWCASHRRKAGVSSRAGRWPASRRRCSCRRWRYDTAIYAPRPTDPLVTAATRVGGICTGVGTMLLMSIFVLPKSATIEALRTLSKALDKLAEVRSHPAPVAPAGSPRHCWVVPWCLRPRLLVCR